MLTEATARKVELSTDDLPAITEFGDRIGVLLYAHHPDGLFVLMELASNISADLNRRWKFPQQELDFTNRLGGYNARRLLEERFQLRENDTKFYEWSDPITEDQLPAKVISLKRFQRTRTIWVSARLEGPMERVYTPSRAWLLASEVPHYCQPFRIKTYEMLVTRLLPPPRPHVPLQ